jgi:hypothetical protein
VQRTRKPLSTLFSHTCTYTCCSCGSTLMPVLQPVAAVLMLLLVCLLLLLLLLPLLC